MGKLDKRDYTPLNEGRVYYMGDGLFLVAKEGDGRGQSVVVAYEDVQALRDSKATALKLTDGTAQSMGDGMWLITQFDELSRDTQDVTLTGQDCETILTTYAYAAPAADRLAA
ncbi:hypothetical protein [Sphingomonas crocodyli]|uniref:Uncharacterized protein n=1 Tax=Sphingomonas crocodyli TaxID=1979270 RepID=A0A437M5S3_9SPHN|nr:hypothetical protein [Sphingomonas crocodyli]RVT92844.1 hypothetical protein EOD43_02710 [Sphingomonas crocodyli]